MSASEVTAIDEDRSGNLWLGTRSAGLDRYDPVAERFTRFTPDPAGLRGPLPGLVWAILEDHGAALWVATAGGLSRLEPASGEWRALAHYGEAPASLSPGAVLALLEDRAGRLWIGTEGGLDRLDRTGGTLDGAEFRHLRHRPEQPAGLSHSTVLALHQDRGSDLWIVTADGVLHRLPATALGDPLETVEPERHRPGPEACGAPILAIQEDREGHLWLGTFGGGLARSDRRTGTFSAFRHDPMDPESLPSDVVRVIREDRDGALWIATRAGVAKLDPRRQRFTVLCHRADRADGFDLGVMALVEGPSGRLWAGTKSGGITVLAGVRPSGVRPSGVRPSGVRPTGAAPCACRSQPAAPRVYPRGTSGPCCSTAAEPCGPGWRVSIRLPAPVSSRSPRCSRRRSCRCSRPEPRQAIQTGRAWERSGPGRCSASIVSPPRGAGRRSPSSRTRTGQPGLERRLLPARGSRASSVGRHLRRLSQLDGPDAFVNHRHGSGRSAQPEQRFRHRDRRGLCGPALVRHLRRRPQPPAAGPGRWSRRRIALAPFPGSGRSGGRQGGGGPRREERPGRRPRPPGGNLWIATNRGLSRFDPATETFRNYDAGDGLHGHLFYIGSALASVRGELLFGGLGGITAFSPQAIKDDLSAPVVALTGLYLDGERARLRRHDPGSPLEQAITAARQLTFSPHQRSFALEFAALYVAKPRKNRYAYRLEGYDPDWIETDAGHRRACYTNLDPGEYVFRVRASNGDGAWNEEGVRLGITVRPPFWETWWFRAVELLVLAGSWGAPTGCASRCSNSAPSASAPPSANG